MRREFGGELRGIKKGPVWAWGCDEAFLTIFKD